MSNEYKVVLECGCAYKPASHMRECEQAVALWNEYLRTCEQEDWVAAHRILDAYRSHFRKFNHYVYRIKHNLSEQWLNLETGWQDSIYDATVWERDNFMRLYVHKDNGLTDEATHWEGMSA